MPNPEIVDVWVNNLEKEMERIRNLVDDYPYIAMDTEFPGVVARPIGNFNSSNDYHYQTLRCNVDLLKIIQLGLTFADSNGNLPPKICTWQFNFKFNLNEDMYAQDSIDLLIRSGIDFGKHEEYGIDVSDFGELLMSSGIVLNDNIKWISFHSGYDFGYLLKVLTCKPLPAEEADFFESVRTYFPCIYDIKHLMKSCKNLKGGLNDLADDLQVERIGPQHQAGSDSLLTCATFFKMRGMFFENTIDDSKHMGVLYGLSDSNALASAPSGSSSSSSSSSLSSSASVAAVTTTITSVTATGSSIIASTSSLSSSVAQAPTIPSALSLVSLSSISDTATASLYQNSGVFLQENMNSHFLV